VQFCKLSQFGGASKLIYDYKLPALLCSHPSNS
jgi:hypothetical protein